MTNIINDPITLGFCFFILLIFIIFFVSLRYKITQVIDEIKTVSAKILTFKYIHEMDDEGEVIELEWVPTEVAATYQHFDKIDKVIQESSALKGQWIEYRSTLQQPYKDFDADIVEEPQVRNTVSASSLFTFSNVISSKLNIRTYTSIPNLLTGLGLLFTFIGLMMGISESATGLSSGDIEAAKSSLSPLLHGASIAFTTSVVGLGLSMVFSFYEKHKFHRVEAQLNNFSRLLMARIKYVDADTLAAMQLTATKEQTRALQGFHQEQQRVTDETIERVCGEFKKALFDSTGSEFDKMREFIGELNNSIQSNVLALNESQNNQQKVHEKACETLVNLTDKVSISLQDNLSKLEDRELKRSDNIMESFAKSIDHMESVNEENSKHIFDTLTFMNSEFESQVQKNIEFVKGSTVENINTLMEKMQDMVHDNAIQFTQTMKVNLSGIMDDLTADIKRSEQAITPLLSTLPDFADKAQKVSVQLRDITQEQFVLTTNVRNTFTDVNSAGALLSKTVNKLTATNQQTIDSSDIYMDIIQTVKETVDSMKESATGIKVSSEEMDKVWNVQKEINHQLESSMKELFNGINQGLTDYSGKTNAYMSSLDGHTAQISQHLVEAINELKVSVEDLKRKELVA